MACGLKSNSIGYLVSEQDATIWRGPMASKALAQILHETRWGEVDYLVVDMPPGTGDIQLTMAQQVPTSAAVIVTTPQDVALADARKGIAMFNKVNVPVLGIVENMSITSAVPVVITRRCSVPVAARRWLSSIKWRCLVSCHCTSTSASTWTMAVPPCSDHRKRTG